MKIIDKRGKFKIVKKKKKVAKESTSQVKEPDQGVTDKPGQGARHFRNSVEIKMSRDKT
jgi:hypothetical protein